MKYKEEILELRKNGKTYNEIVEILKCSKSTVSYYCKSYSLDDLIVSNTKRKEEIISFFKKNNDFEKTISEFGISREKLVIILGKIRKVKCPECEKELDVSLFCKTKCCSDECRRENKNKRNKENNYYYKQVKNWRKEKKKKAIEYKGGKCIICSYSRCDSALEFHHLDPKQKDFSISTNINWSFDKIKTELDKCVLVCSNCHREIHEGLIEIMPL